MRRTNQRANLEAPIVYAVIEWLDASGWPLVFPEVSVPRGLIRGRVDVAAVSKNFRNSVAVEVKAVYRPDDAEYQLFDGQRAAEMVYLAAPSDVLAKTDVPTGVGILESRSAGGRATLVRLRRAVPKVPDRNSRKEFLHALMRSARRRGRLDTTWTEGRVCPACLSGSCPFWESPLDFDSDGDDPALEP